MTFKPGQQKPPGSGRKKGALDKRQILKRESARSAIELLSQHGFDPITWQSEIANLQHLTALRMALGRLPNEHDTEAQFAEAIASMESRGDKRLVLDWLKATAVSLTAKWRASVLFCARQNRRGEVGEGGRVCRPDASVCAAVKEAPQRGKVCEGHGVPSSHLCSSAVLL
jgi:hypothetical protein